MSLAAPHSPPGPSPAPAVHGELARAFQEIFTVVVRVRSNRQSARDAASFRAHAKRLVAGADEAARSAGYDGESVRQAVYAVVAFLDEAVLNSNEPMFADWPRQPLQEEVFGDHMAGETFFRTLSDLLARTDSEALADLLEVYQLCLVLGFRGRFAAGGEGEIHRFTATIDDRLARIRGGHPPFAPSALLPADERIPTARDPWVRRLALTAAGIAVIALLAYLGYTLVLGAGAADLASIAEAVR